MVKVIHL